MLPEIEKEEVISKIDFSKWTLDYIFHQLLDHAVALGLKLIAVAVVFFVGRWAIGWLRRFITRFLEKRHIEGTVKSFLDSLINITLKVVLFVLIINVLGISTTSFAAILAAMGLAVGMAMKDNLSNFAGGVMLLINKPFKVGDRIISQGMDGVVQSVGILYTVLLTSDNRTIYVPNGPVSTGSITNFSTQRNRRIDITLNVTNGVDSENIKAILQSIIKSVPMIKKTPSPFVGVTMLNNSNVDITIRVWVDSSDYGSVNVDLNEKIYMAFRENGIYKPSLVNVKMVTE